MKCGRRTDTSRNTTRTAVSWRWAINTTCKLNSEWSDCHRRAKLTLVVTRAHVAGRRVKKPNEYQQRVGLNKTRSRHLKKILVANSLTCWINNTKNEWTDLKILRKILGIIRSKTNPRIIIVRPRIFVWSTSAICSPSAYLLLKQFVYPTIRDRKSILRHIKIIHSFCLVLPKSPLQLPTYYTQSSVAQLCSICAYHHDTIKFATGERGCEVVFKLMKPSEGRGPYKEGWRLNDDAFDRVPPR